MSVLVICEYKPGFASSNSDVDVSPTAKYPRRKPAEKRSKGSVCDENLTG
jgi:hypothetical protein